MMNTPIYTNLRRELRIPEALWGWHFENAAKAANVAIRARARKIMLETVISRDAVVALGGHCCGGGANPGGHEWNCKVYR